MRLRSAIAAMALVPTTLAFTAVATTATEDGCRTDEDRTVTVENEDGTTTEVPVEYCEFAAFANCDNAIDSDGASKVVDPTAAVNITADAPTESFTAGAGCGTVDEPFISQVTHEPGLGHYHLATAGNLKNVGNVDTLTFEVHFLGPNVGYAGRPIDMDVRMTIDNTSLFGTTTETGATGDEFESPVAKPITVVPQLSETGASTSALITVTGISDLFPEDFAAEAGQGTEKRKVAISFNFPFDSATGFVPMGASFMVMGATEVPTGVTFNKAGEDLGVIVPANR